MFLVAHLKLLDPFHRLSPLVLALEAEARNYAHLTSFDFVVRDGAVAGAFNDAL
jgi:hypothetical protein